MGGGGVWGCGGVRLLEIWGVGVKNRKKKKGCHKPGSNG